MKIIRWLLSHTFLILVIIVVIYGYMFWGNLAGENTPAGKAIAYLSSEFDEVGEFVAAIKEKQAQRDQQAGSLPSSSESSTPEHTAAVQSQEAQSQEALPQGELSQVEQQAVPTSPAPAEEQVQAAAVESGENVTTNSRDIEQQAVSISYSHNQVQITQDSTGAVTRESRAAAVSSEPESSAVTEESDVATGMPPVVSPVTPVDMPQETSPVATKRAVVDAEAAVTPESDATFVPEALARQLDNVDEHGKVKDSARQGLIVRQAWITARKSFYQRNYRLSELSYQQVIENTDDNFDAYGELGNVYFNQGKKTEAASAYYEAAVILLGKGQLNRARSLLGLLQRLDKSKANDLQKLIEASMS